MNPNPILFPNAEHRPRPFKDYWLLELRGEGGQGQVWKAQIKETGQIVALKVLRGPFKRLRWNMPNLNWKP